ncbi:MAG: flippase-like domain-containing protein [Chloroflexi bacterium]|nr:flippase-like domain-containing protein [Chloroflexota bacterium]
MSETPLNDAAASETPTSETTQPQTTPRPTRSIPWMWIFTLALAALLLYLAFRGVDWGELLAIVQQGRLESLILAGLVMIVSYFLRSLRWRVLVNAEGGVPVAATFWGVWVGYMGNYFLPARAGEFLRSVMVARRVRLQFGFVLATTLTERIMDAGALVLIVLATISALPEIPAWLETGAQTMALLAVVGILGLMIAPHLEGLIRRILAWLPLPGRVGALLDDFTARFLLGIRALQNPGRAAIFLTMTVVVWGVDVVFAQQIAAAFGLALTVPQILLLIAALGLSSAAPSTPGYLGIYQFVSVAILTPFGYSEAQALVFIIALQAVTYILVVIFGLLGLWQLGTPGVRVGELLRQRTAATTDG